MSQNSLIGAGTVVRGSIEGEGSLEVQGRVEGDVRTNGDVVVGSGGAVLGNIEAATIRIDGAVQGNLNGRDAVLLEGGARVVGDLTAPRIGIAHGALVRGSVRTEGEPNGAPNRKPVAAAAKPAFVPKPVAKVEPRPPAPAPTAPVVHEAPAEPPVSLSTHKDREVERRPPPPILPSLGKGAKGKKKGQGE